jgi:hypothetical protein
MEEQTGDANATASVWKNRDIETVIRDLRAEVSALKACVAQYSLQAVGFSAVVWGLFFKPELRSTPVVFACGAIVTALLLLVAQMANHKYRTINRNLAYELHLYRLKDYAAATTHDPTWTQRMLDVGWEEGMCAWRIVQPTISDALYRAYAYNTHLSNWLASFTDKHRWTRTIRTLFPIGRTPLARGMKYPWYSTSRLIENQGASYFPGAYLRNVQSVLYAVVLLSLGLMWCFELAIVRSRPGAHGVCTPDAFKMLALAALSAVHQVFSRKILECELESIQSSAVVWRIVITCHVLAAVRAIGKYDSYQYYTKNLARLCKAFTRPENIDNPHEWLRRWHRIPDVESLLRETDAICVD